MHDKVIHVMIMHQKVAKFLGQHLLDAVLLCADEALYHHAAEQPKVRHMDGAQLPCGRCMSQAVSVVFCHTHART